MDKHQALAIFSMGAATHQYNAGVLGMLGKADLAAAHHAASASCAILCDERDALIETAMGGSQELVDMLAASELPAIKAIQSKLDEAVAIRNAAWAPIQAVIDDAREIAEPILSDFLP